MKSNLISKSETISVLNEISSQWKIDIPKVKNLKFHHVSEHDAIIIGDGISAIKLGQSYLPFLEDIDILEKFPSVMVDMGAIKFVCKGANIMRPGITKFTEFEKEQIVCVIEESQKKFLAVGISCMSSSEMESLQKGEVIKNMHYVSDKFWESSKEIKD